MVMQYHPRIGHIHVPNMIARIPHEIGGYFVRTNAAGFRSDTEFKKKRGERPRILVFGDSFTAGEGCNNHERYAELLGQELDAEVYNYGLSGSAPDQHILLYEEFCREMEADLVVWGISIHNIDRIQLTHRPSVDRVSHKPILIPKPYFSLEDGNLRLHHVPVPQARPQSDEQSLAQYEEGYLEPPSLEQFYQLAWLDPVRRLLRSYLSGLKHHARGLAYRSTNVQLYADYQHEDSPGWQLMAAIIKRFHETVAKVPLLVVPLPTYHYYVDKLKPIYQSLFASLADEHPDLFVYDLTSDLVRLPLKQRTQLCFEQDSHYSPFGHREIARLIAEEICAKKLLPAHGTEPKTSRKRESSGNRNSRYLLGISAFSHNSAAVLVKDGQIIAAVEEERFTRVKGDHRFPHQAINYCLEEARSSQHELAAVVCDKVPALVLEHIVHSVLAAASEESWLQPIRDWADSQLNMSQLIRQNLQYNGLLLQCDHVHSMVAGAFYPSPFQEAAIVCIDGAGEWVTASIGVGTGTTVEILKVAHFPHSFSHLHAAFRQFLGLAPHDGEIEMLGLAAGGKPEYLNTIVNNVVDLKDDGSIELNLEYFSFQSGQPKFSENVVGLLGGNARMPDAPITQREMDLAASVQALTEEALLRMAHYACRVSGQKNLCMAGRMGHNAAANRRLVQEGPFEQVWIQPAPGDAGSALGAALHAAVNYFGGPRRVAEHGGSPQGGSCWGPRFPNDEVRAFLGTNGYCYHMLDEKERAERVAGLLAEGKIVGHVSGRMEFGTHGLGARSVLGDPRVPDVRARFNTRSGQGDHLYPVSVSVLQEKAGEYVALDHASPFMLERASCANELLHDFLGEEVSVQTVNQHDHPVFYDVLRTLEEKTGSGLVLNASFNLQGRPIVCTPFDAYHCFMVTDIDVLVIEDFLLLKIEQPPWPESELSGKACSETHADISSQDPFIQALRTLYANKVEPLMHRLKESHRALAAEPFRTTSSQWQDCASEASAKTVYTIPLQLDQPVARAKDVAEAVLSSWHSGPVLDGFRPILKELIHLKARF
jgi:carbamoyltransferase